MTLFRIFFPKLHNFKLSHFQSPIRYSSKFKTKLYENAEKLIPESNVDRLIKKISPRVIYNSIIEWRMKGVQYTEWCSRRRKKISSVDDEPIPASLKYFSDDIIVDKKQGESTELKIEETIVDFPFKRNFSIENDISDKHTNNDSFVLNAAEEAEREIRERRRLLEMKKWMTDYDNYDDRNLEDQEDEVRDLHVNYGTPDPQSKVTNIPCGGCGALLHCKDPSVPGYIPSEIFYNSFEKGGAALEAIVCQRCHFLKNYNMALQVQVTPEDYPKVLQTISKRRGLVILMVDLLDFPCSIWPGIGEIFGHQTPIVVVGNKVDLLTQDSEKFLARVRNTLLNHIKLQGFATFNIKEVVLISAKTGFGIEDLITKLNSLYRTTGDVYIVGCTNVGKSSLFNAFLQSDYCKSKAVDLVQRATTSVWPGTTLNLLKFPIKRPRGPRQFYRMKRLRDLHKMEAIENELRKEQLRNTKDPKYASLIGHLHITKNPILPETSDDADLFSIKGHGTASGRLTMGIRENDPDFVASKWCYDTPGVVQPDQIIHLLTTEELLLTLPKDIVVPRNFCLKPNTSLFIAGLARLDCLDALRSVKFTVFASNDLPITVCDVKDADSLYEEMIGTELLKVPCGGPQRIEKWPKLQMAREFSLTAKSWNESTIDVVLSNAGWIAIAGRNNFRYNFRAWTPEKRGVYIRESMLPHAVNLFGERIKRSVAYKKFNFYLK